MRRHLAYAAAGAAVLALAGCGDDPEPQVADPTATPSSSSSPSESAAAEKEPWEKESEEGVIAFAEQWISWFDQSKQTGDTEALAAASSSECTTCQNYIALTKDIYSDGGFIESKGWRVLSVSTPADDASPTTRVSMRIAQSPQRLKRSADAKTEQFAGGESTYTAQVRWVEDGWTMMSLDIVE
ncbi:hypothetical protein NOK12_11740 [Nocardioides sp. OK12]|uniref:DUF6318 family protein n=1 Tax=Nocardioides sp. OK12 TaxID=2758661 RepID=UPI0021C39D96|nr:DUF6318 family protein [Nocardioides sp. OK12]GHJ58656.1 hypothetical protein NOK12_11740 [Nocardioides sp. OK12]